MATPELIEVDNVVDIINCVAYTTPQRMFKIAFLQFGSHEYVFERPLSFIRYEGRFFVDFAQ